jgi:hypothetical protein
MVRLATLSLVLAACGSATTGDSDATSEAAADVMTTPALDATIDAPALPDAHDTGVPDAAPEAAPPSDTGPDRPLSPPDAAVDAGPPMAACPSAGAGIPQGTLVLQSQEMLRELIIGRWVLCDGPGFIVPEPPYNKVISIEADNTFSFWKMENGAFARAPDLSGTWNLRSTDFDVYFAFPGGNGGSIRPYFEKNRRWMYAYSVFSGDSYYVPDPTWH